MGILNPSGMEDYQNRLEAMETNLKTISDALKGIDGYKEQLDALNRRVDEIRDNAMNGIEKVRTDTFDALKCISVEPATEPGEPNEPPAPTLDDILYK